MAAFLAASVALCALRSSASGADHDGDTDRKTADARALFSEGAEQARNAHWAEALATFEEVQRVRPHPVVVFNIGTCQRALGRYVRARASFAAFLEGAARDPTGVDSGLLEEGRTLTREIEGLLVHVRVQLAPTAARLAVDGRPLLKVGPDMYAAGLAASGAPETVGEPLFDLILDPGAHVIHATREGHQDAVVNRSWPPAARESLDLSLETLPARIDVSSAVSGARVLVDGLDVGIVPLALSRPGGKYKLSVEHNGYVPYSTTLAVEPGQHLTMDAKLSVETKSLLKQWWFWAAVGGAIAAGVGITYAATRSPSPPAPYDGGGAGWVVVIP